MQKNDKAMGFCVYNNVAVGAYYLIRKIQIKIKWQLLISMFTMVTEHKTYIL